MATLVFFHAHPDDESILTGGSIARAPDEGHRVVLAFGTEWYVRRGVAGPPVDGWLVD